ncbi:hypothetical protein [Corynebacterium sp. ZY180755]
MTTGEDTHGSDYFTPIFLLPQLCNSTQTKAMITASIIDADTTTKEVA